MVRFEKQGNTFVMITGTGQTQNIRQQSISVLISAISELSKNPPDRDKINEGLLYLDNSIGTDLRKEIKTVLQKAADNKGMTVTDL